MLTLHNCSWACSIPDYETDTLVLAGGSSPGKMVSRWGYDAFVMICYDRYCCHDTCQVWAWRLGGRSPRHADRQKRSQLLQLRQEQPQGLFMSS